MPTFNPTTQPDTPIRIDPNYMDLDNEGLSLSRFFSQEDMNYKVEKPLEEYIDRGIIKGPEQSLKRLEQTVDPKYNISMRSSLYGKNESTNNLPSMYTLRETMLFEDLALQRAERYNFAVNGDTLNEENIFNTINSGEEDTFRARQSLEDRTRLNLRRANLLRSYTENLPSSEMTEERLNELRKLDAKEVEEAYANPATFFERKFARRVREISHNDVKDTQPEVRANIDTYNDVLINQATARKFLEEYEYNPDTERSWGQAAKPWIPFWRWSVLSDAYEGEDGRSWLLGTNIRQQVQDAYRLSPDQFYETQKKVLDELRERDPELALHYASALLGYTSSDEFSDNLNSYIDASLLTPLPVLGILGKDTLKAGASLGARSASAGIQGTKDYLRNLDLVATHGRMRTKIKGMSGSNLDYTAILNEQRRVHQRAFDSLRAKAANTGQIKDFDELFQSIQDIHNPKSVLTGTSDMTAEQVARLEVSLLRQRSTAIEQILTKPRNLPRLSEEELALATSRAEQFLDRMYANTTLGARIVKIKSSNIEARNILANTDAVGIYLGNTKGGGYASQAAAKGAGTKLGLQKFTTEEVDGKWYVKFYEFVDEKDPTLHAFRTPNRKYANKDRTSFLAPVLSFVRMRDNLVPEQLSEDLLVAQAGTNAYFQANEKVFLESFGKLNKQSKKDLDAFLERERDYRVETNNPNHVVRGRYSNNVGELRENFSKEMGRQPTIDEIDTYFSWKTWNDIDYATRNLDLTRDMVRLGIKSHKLLFRYPGAEQVQRTPALEGKILLDFPWDRQGDAGILIWDPSETHLMFRKDRYGRFDPETNTTKTFSNPIRKKYMNRDQQDYINYLMKDKGYVAVQLTPWAKKTLQETMENWGGSAPKPPTPYKAPIPQTEAEKALAKLQQNTLQYLEKASTAREAGNIADDAFYRAMASNKVFRDNYKDNIPDSVAERANAIVDAYGYQGGLTFRKGRYKESAQDPKGFPSLIGNLFQTRQNFGRKFRESDFTSQGVLKNFSQRNRKRIAEELGKRVQNSKLKDDKVLSTSSDFQIKPITSIAAINDLLGSLAKGNIEIKNAYTKPSAAPFYLISKPNSTLEEGIDIVVLNNASKINQKKYEELFPEVKFLTVPQGEEYLKSGKLPKQKSLHELVAEQDELERLAQEGFTPGDRVVVLSAEDKKELAKTGSIKGIEGKEQFTVQNVLTDENNPEFGAYVQLEGSSTGISAEDLYVISKQQDTASKQVRRYMEGLDLQGKQRYDYILVRPEDGLETSALNFQRFPYREGGHKLIEDDWKVVEPEVFSHYEKNSRISTYEGDTNMYTAKTEADARIFNDRINEVKRILKDDLAHGTNNAEAFYKSFLDGTSKSWDDFKRQFKQVHGKGHLDLDRPNVVVPRDQSAWKYINDLKNADGTPYYSNLENQRDSAHNLFHNDLNLKYALERSDNLESVSRKGTRDNPVFGTETGGNLSPMATLINSTNQMIRGRLIDDLKFKSAENFGKTFASVIDATPEEIARDPMEYLINPKWKTGLKGQDASLLLAAKDYRRAVTDFIGIKTPTQEWMENIQMQIGEEITKKLQSPKYQWIDQHLRRSAAFSPLRWANNMVFDLYFGFFNVKQLLTQAMSSYHTVAVLGPEKGVRAGFAAHLARWGLYETKPERIALLARTAERSGLMSSDEFVEALDAYRNTGFHIIRQETAMQDDFINQSIKPGFVERGRDAARFFFKEGDRFSRSTGWFGAYIEWRAANPGVKLTPRISAELLKRANDLTLNMTSVSQAQMAKGVGNIPLKFTTYYLRVMEQLLPGWTGSRLTSKEKMRAYAMYGIMFGAPITAAGTFGLWPFHKEVAKTLIDNGYETDENLVLKAFNGGLAELLPHLVGVDQNFSETLGPSGTTWLYDIYNGRSPIFDVVTGVGGTKLEDTFEASWPFFTLMANAFRSDDKKYPLQWSDLEHFARSISSVNNTWRSIQMYNTGIYMSLNRTPLMRDVTTTDAAMNFLFGTNPTELQQAFVKSDMVRTTRDMKKAAKKDIIREHRLQMKAIVDDDLEGAMQHGKAIKFLLQSNGFTPNELNSVFSDTITANRDLVTLAEKNFNNSTPERKQMYLDKYSNEREAK